MLLTISLMAIGTLGLVLTPLYATIGPSAPVILIVARLVQGLALAERWAPIRPCCSNVLRPAEAAGWSVGKALARASRSWQPARSASRSR